MFFDEHARTALQRTLLIQLQDADVSDIGAERQLLDEDVVSTVREYRKWIRPEPITWWEQKLEPMKPWVRAR
jgi:hypothetical protein